MTNKTMNNKTTTNKTAEAIINGSNPTTEELFDLINVYGITMLSIQDENHKTMNMNSDSLILTQNVSLTSQIFFQQNQNGYRMKI